MLKKELGGLISFMVETINEMRPPKIGSLKKSVFF
jgi:hypothetical protein